MSSNIIPIVLGVLVALVGSGGVVYTALRFNRDEADRIVRQQAQILIDMDNIYQVVKRERDELLVEVVKLRREVRAYRQAIRRMEHDANAQ